MFKQLKKQPNISGMASDATGTGEIPTTGTLYAIYLRFDDDSTDVKSEINNIVVRLDGEEVVNATPTFLFDLQKYYGDAIGDGNKSTANTECILPIYFTRPYLPSDSERSLFALGLADVDSVVVDIVCGTLVNVSSCEVFASMTPENRNLGQHIRIHKFPQNYATTGTQEITTLPKGGASVGYLAMHIEDNTGTIQQVSVKKGGYAIHDQVRDLLHQAELSHNFRTRQTGYYHADFSQSRDLRGFIPMAGVKDWRQEIVWITAAPNNYNIYTERIFGLNIKP